MACILDVELGSLDRCLSMEARRCPLTALRPSLQCMSYRSGHHSTSDDSSRYRTAEEIRSWKVRDPVARFQSWMTHSGWWDEDKEQALRQATRREVRLVGRGEGACLLC